MMMTMTTTELITLPLVHVHGVTTVPPLLVFDSLDYVASKY